MCDDNSINTTNVKQLTRFGPLAVNLPVQINIPPPHTAMEAVALILRFSLFGHRLVPIRLKMILERILADLVVGVNTDGAREMLLARVGWTVEDLSRGYVVIGTSTIGTPEQDRWSTVSVQSELNILQIIQTLLPIYGRLADSLRQSVLQSLMPTAVPAIPNGFLLSPAAPAATMESTIKPAAAIENNDIEVPEAVATAADCTSNETAECIEVDMDEESEGGDGEVSIKGDSATEAVERVRRPQRINKNGKRRIQCPSCGLTYCDKGALKIHNSAVHLKETHKCTVPGCDKIFSSRRSRHAENSNIHNAAASIFFKRGCSAATTSSTAAVINSDTSPSSTGTSMSPLPSNLVRRHQFILDSANGGRKRKCERPIKISEEGDQPLNLSSGDGDGEDGIAKLLRLVKQTQPETGP